MYGVLALAFYPPTADATRLVREAVRLSRASQPDGSRRGLDSKSIPETEFRELEREYNRLFVGPGHVVCPPYESVYSTDGQSARAGLILGPPSVAVRSSYGEAGLVIAQGFTDLPDHVAVELEFMKYLCDKEASAEEKDKSQWRSRQVKFISEHVGRWMPAFADSVAKNTTSPYYRAAARLLKEFSEAEAESLLPGAG